MTTKTAKNISFNSSLKQENEIVSNYLLYYHELHNEYLEKREDIIHYKKVGRVFKDKKQGSPTESKGRKLIDNLQKTEQWLKLISEVERNLPPELKVYLKLRREYRDARGRTGWTAAIQSKLPDELSKLTGENPETIWIESRNTFTRWWDKIVEYTARLALRNGLL